MHYQGDNMMDVKRTNRSAALRILHEQGGMSRKRLAEAMKLTPAAITKIIGELIDEGLVIEGETLPGGGAGRREVTIGLDNCAYCALGLFINLRETILSAVWLDGSVIFSEHIEIPEKAEPETTIRMLSDRLLEATLQHGIDRNRIIGLGIAIRGITSADGRVIRNSFRSLDAEDYPIADRFEEYTGLRTVMANNVRALFSAHNYLSGAEAGSSRFFLRCEYGIGAALTVNGSLWHGWTQQCAEIGHIPVVKAGGKLCSCGKTGCLETIASPTAITADAEAAFSEDRTPVLYSLCGGDRKAISLETIFEAAAAGDSVIGQIVDRAVEALSSALKSVIYLIDPQEIVLYGRMFENEYYLSRLYADLCVGVDETHTTSITKSRFNRLLEDSAAGLVMIEDFINHGGMI